MTCLPIVRRGKVVGSVSVGGPDLRISCNEGVVRFEDHHYCGPLPVDKNGNGRSLPPSHSFWRRVTEWYAAGKLVENGFAVLRKDHDADR